MTSYIGKRVRAIALIASCLLFISTFLIEQPAFAYQNKGNGVNVIIMIGDGMGWEPARTGAIAKGASFYTSGKGNGLNMQKLKGYTYATTYGTTIFDAKSGKFATSNSALDDSNPVTGKSNVRPDFSFKPFPFNPGTDLTANASGGATDPSLGNLTGWEVDKGGPNPWTPATPQPCDIEVPQGQSINNIPNRYTCQAEYIKLSLPDSANTAFTLYTGVKSYNNAMVDIFEKPVETILQTARNQGKSTGLVTSVPITHATPGSAEASVNRRSKYDSDFPTLDSLLQQSIRPNFDNNPDRPDLQEIFLPTVLLGGGHPLDHDNTVNTPGQPGYKAPGTCNYVYIKSSTYKELTGKTSLSDAEACKATSSSNPENRYGYRFLERGPFAANLLLKTSNEIDPNEGERLLGLYGARGQEGNIPVSGADGDYSITGLANFARQTSLYYRTNDPYKRGDVPVNDTDRPLQPDETDEEFITREVKENPTLADMTQAALNVLGKDKDGFWLMVEGGDIDWGIHDNNIDNIIGTVFDFDKAVGTVIRWIEGNGGWRKNVLIVTADHDHYLTLYPNFPELLKTKGAKELTYGTETNSADVGHSFGSIPEDKYGWGNHTRRPVPVYYQGFPFKLDKYVGKDYEAYGFNIPGIPGGVDEVHIYKAMYEAITGKQL
ncbi:MAG: alkaline phosphatase [Stigonema ocellatum SAG 48.90 = DSM 106950]|nr:alkaline phosphatase [Stigonema ocellatum SAG 48.90 = DSM 106950]